MVKLAKKIILSRKKKINIYIFRVKLRVLKQKGPNILYFDKGSQQKF
jgi:hypothetical protein